VYVGNRAVQPLDDVTGAGGVGVAGELVNAVRATSITGSAPATASGSPSTAAASTRNSSVTVPPVACARVTSRTAGDSPFAPRSAVESSATGQAVATSTPSFTQIPSAITSRSETETEVHSGRRPQDRIPGRTPPAPGKGF
jgi:hypothetical protein